MTQPIPSSGLVLDIDGVCCNTARPVTHIIRQELGVHQDAMLPLGDDYATGITDQFPEHLREQAIEILRQAFDHNYGDVYDHAIPEPGAVAGAHALHQAGLLRGYVTRRPGNPEVITATQRFLDTQQFPSLPVLHAPRGTAKTTPMRQLGADTIIEDSPYEIEGILADGLGVIVMTHPYNAQLGDALPRLNGWHDLPNLLPTLKERKAA